MAPLTGAVEQAAPVPVSEFLGLNALSEAEIAHQRQLALATEQKTDPRDKVAAGLICNGVCVPLQRVHVFARLVDLASQVLDLGFRTALI